MRRVGNSHSTRLQLLHPDAGTTSYTYDLAGNVLTTQTANLSSGSQYIHYNYDHARLSSIEYPQNPEMNVYYEYGSANSGTQSGRLMKQQDASGIQTFEYGKMGELVRNIHTFVVPGGVPYSFETRWKYDSWNRMDSIYYPDGEVVTYHYDNGGNLVSMDGVKGSQNFAYVNDVRYNKYGSRTRIDYGNSTYAQYTYNPLNQRLTNLKSYDNLSNLMQDIAYTYDDASNITAIENTAGYVNGDLGGICVNYYTYDDLYRLTNAEGAFVSYNNSTLYHSLEMSYSASGNILSKDVYSEKEIGGGVQTVNYSNTYQYGDRPHNVTSAGNFNYEWDANGNLVARGNGTEERHLCWDEENRLTTVRDNGEQGVLSSYIYNAGGERIWKLTGDAYDMYVNGQYVYGGVGFSKTLYSSPYVVLTDEEYTKHYYIEGERICSKLGGGFALADIEPTSTPINFLEDDAGEVASNLWNMVKRGIDCTGFPSENVESKKELRSAENQNDDEEINQYYYHPDHLGSSSFITDATGTAIQHLEYLPYGELWVNQQSGSFDSRYKFSAKELDDETNYSYFGARYYDSDLSTWLSVDAYASNYPMISPYSYCASNPVMLFDPNGNWIVRNITRYKNGRKLSKITFRKADRIDMDIKIHQAKIFNATSEKLDDQKLLLAAEEIKNDIINDYNTSVSNKGKTINISAEFVDEFQVVNDLSDVQTYSRDGKKADNLWVIANEDDVSKIAGKRAGAYTTAGSNVSIIGANSFKSLDNGNLRGMNHDSSHEFGHQLGLGLIGGHNPSIESIMYEEGTFFKNQDILFRDARLMMRGTINSGIDLQLLHFDNH